MKQDHSDKLFQFLNKLTDAIHLAIMAQVSKMFSPRYRPLGRSVTPYHYMQLIPLPLPVQRIPHSR